MKTDSQRLLTGAPPQERAILDQIRDDHELVARLKITPQEIEALSKCSLLGTLTCKEDMLFILRQIREATSPSSSGQIQVFPEPVTYSEDEEQKDPPSDFRQIQSRVAQEIIPEPGSLEGLVRRRLPEKFAVPFLAAVVAVGLCWNGIIAVSRWHDIFITRVGLSVSQAPASEVWFNHLDRFGVLLLWEALIVVRIIGVIYCRSLRGSSRFKVRPGWRF